MKYGSVFHIYIPSEIDSSCYDLDAHPAVMIGAFPGAGHFLVLIGNSLKGDLAEPFRALSLVDYVFLYVLPDRP